ncbi:MarR family winged helix-turn-helix transcriptional regulator [Paractinoplanes toevensis]|uniref:MarR family transcriptional regulator n=1 Tax=Paractinoplanes toevensis TaxID=571911 RepID=A0A919TH68_9ACTN|nr:MarR family winged helix-turn-helix transcriptional regulator [Actinoplanes toevensis]GIM94846.1 MarR family transcriptional regulator [Actinoplanes toevensis]
MADEVPYAPERIRRLPSWLLGRAAARGHRLVAEALAGEGVRMMHHAVLASVAELGPVSQSTLSRTLRVDPKEMVAIVRDLHGDGLVDRQPDPADRRKHAISLSPAGRALLARTERLGAAANDRLTAALSPAERDQLRDLLGRIIAP